MPANTTRVSWTQRSSSSSGLTNHLERLEGTMCSALPPTTPTPLPQEKKWGPSWIASRPAIIFQPYWMMHQNLTSALPRSPEIDLTDVCIIDVWKETIFFLFGCCTSGGITLVSRCHRRNRSFFGTAQISIGSDSSDNLRLCKQIQETSHQSFNLHFTIAIFRASQVTEIVHAALACH